MSRTLLVTGGAGFIGSEFVRQWLANQPEDRVVVLDALTYAGNLANLAPVWEDPRFRFYPGRIEDSCVVAGIFRAEHPDYVLNFAAESHNDRSILDPVSLVATNVAGVGVLLEACRQFGVKRFLHVSTDEVYGEIESGLFRETDPLEPRTPYSAAKAGGELQVRAHRIAYGTDTIITRGSNTYGPYQYPEKLLPFFITRALNDKKVPVYGAGDQVRDWIHVSDHCAGIAVALLHGEPGAIYNVGGSSERRNIEVTRRLLALLGKPETLIKHIGDPRGASHDRRYALDTSRLQALGWQPRVPFEEGLESTVRWYREHRAWWEPTVQDAGYREFVARYYGRYLGDDL
jgi:dTDP-glucose 4,6-dehydratase